jgi:D-alanyl-D-alanine-carboxypeptidase/D-alanyl-D-alanine-endopeptidase
MLQRRRLMLGALAAPLIGSRAEAQNGVPASTLSSETIREMLAEYAGPGAESLGYVVGIGDAGERRVISVGASGAMDQRALGGSSVFEIGSITKVFTALLMAEMAQRGEVSFDDPVAEYLPPEGRPHQYEGRAITLIQNLEAGLNSFREVLAGRAKVTA